MNSSGGEPHRHEDRESERPDPLATVKRGTRERIDDDRRRYPEDLGPVFEVLAARMFEPDFDAKEAVPDPGTRRRFRIEVGVSPRAYRDNWLLTTALEAVQRTSLPILEIAASLGFEDPELFSKWFKWRTGESPLATRTTDAPLPRRAETRGPAAEPAGDEPWSTRECRRAAAWDVSPRRGAALLDRIRALYPALAGRQPVSE